ncbi:MAG: hypothetical protein AAFX87_16535 [Bacteroidota bacterium]
MQPNKTLILTLIQADLKHYQLINGLENLHLHTESHSSELYKVVAELMGLGKGKSDIWFDVYCRFLQEAHQHPMSNGLDELLPVAEECYEMLLACSKIERHLSA